MLSMQQGAEQNDDKEIKSIIKTNRTMKISVHMGRSEFYQLDDVGYAVPVSQFDIVSSIHQTLVTLQKINKAHRV